MSDKKLNTSTINTRRTISSDKSHSLEDDDKSKEYSIENSQISHSDDSHTLEEESGDEQFNIDKHEIEDEKSPKTEEKVKELENAEGLSEMGGLLIYDSYAKLYGNEKVETYYKGHSPPHINKEIVFDQDYQQEIFQTYFGDKAREHDFKTENDKYVYKNLTRFLSQRYFNIMQSQLFVPQMQNVLIFDSRFENGNLRKASKVNNIEYNLWLENDWNTKGHTQWYYFKVIYKDISLGPEKKVHKIKFNILNLGKTSSLYQEGMIPCIWSKRKYEQTGTGWFRGGSDISYTKNDIPRFAESTHTANVGNQFLYQQNGAGEGTETYFTFSFKYEFEPNQNDEVWFAHAVPYTYTEMQNKMQKIKQKKEFQDFVSVDMLCKSLGKNPVPLLTITSKIETYMNYYDELNMKKLPSLVKKAYRQLLSNTRKLIKQGQQATYKVQKLLEAAIQENIKHFSDQYQDEFLQLGKNFDNLQIKLQKQLKDHGQKKGIVITCRVHPGEPQASHMLDGLIDFLLSNEGEKLRNNFVIRIVPMLNPDGVVYGNYRCSLLGCDLNRRWDKPNRLLHPTVFYSKQLIKNMHQERRVIMFCDLHGHSRKQNAFFYGCCYKNFEQEGRIKNAQLRIIPLMCCQKNNLFSLKGCRFNVDKSKESTARVVIFREYNIMNSFTLECSFFGKESNCDDSGGLSPSKQQPKKKKFEQMSIYDYQSMGQSMIQTMNNYLPAQIHNLSFLSGKILNIFYDEFTKFVPAYILKREEERRLKIEQKEQSTVKISQGKLQKRQTTHTSLLLKISVIDSKKVEDENISQDKMLDFSSGSELDYINQSSQNQGDKPEDIAEFETFMSNIMTQIKDKKTFFNDKGSSDGSSAEEEVQIKVKHKKKKKREKNYLVKQQTKLGEKVQAKKKADLIKEEGIKKVKKTKTQINLFDKNIKKQEQNNIFPLKIVKPLFKLPSTVKSNQFKMDLLTEEQIQSLLIQHPNVMDAAGQEELVKEITRYLQQNHKLNQPQLEIQEQDNNGFNFQPSPVQKNRRKIKTLGESLQNKLESQILSSSLENQTQIQKHSQHKQKQSNASSSAFYAHLVPKDQLSSSSVNRMYYDKVLGGKIKFKQPNSPTSPSYKLSDDNMFANAFHKQNAVVLPQLVSQIIPKTTDFQIKQNLNSSQLPKKMRNQDFKHSQNMNRKPQEAMLRFNTKKQRSLVTEQSPMSNFYSNDSNLANAVIGSNEIMSQIQLKVNSYNLKLPKHPTFRIKANHLPNTRGAIIEEDHMESGRDNCYDMDKMVNVPIYSNEMQQETNINSNLFISFKEQASIIPQPIYRACVLQSTPTVYDAYPQNTFSGQQTVVGPNTETNLTEIKEYLNIKLSHNTPVKRSILPELKTRHIKNEVSHKSKYQVTKKMLDKQKYLQAQLENQQFLLQEMRNQIQSQNQYQSNDFVQAGAQSSNSNNSHRMQSQVEKRFQQNEHFSGESQLYINFEELPSTFNFEKSRSTQNLSKCEPQPNQVAVQKKQRKTPKVIDNNVDLRQFHIEQNSQNPFKNNFEVLDQRRAVAQEMAQHIVNLQSNQANIIQQVKRRRPYNTNSNPKQFLQVQSKVQQPTIKVNRHINGSQIEYQPHPQVQTSMERRHFPFTTMGRNELNVSTGQNTSRNSQYNLNTSKSMNVKQGKLVG